MGGFVAGKTGTSRSCRDAWFIGFNESMVTGAWAGNDDMKRGANRSRGSLSISETLSSPNNPSHGVPVAH
jgi:membrane peptidoglycan carboxypeptidase